MDIMPSSSQSKEPRFELENLHEGEKWCVEYHRGRQDLAIEDASMKQAVFVHGCENCTLKIDGKVKRIVVDNCAIVTIEFISALSGLEIYNSSRMVAIVSGNLPTATIIKTNRLQLDLGRDSEHCEVSASCCSDINVSITKDGGGRTHFHIPEQTKTVWNGQKFVTTIDEKS